MIVARRFLVSGRVQGVGYRFHARGAAARESLGGFVRNLSDGRVEVQAEGDRDAMRRFERALRQGPPAGRVDAVAVTDLPPGAAGSAFRIEVDRDPGREDRDVDGPMEHLKSRIRQVPDFPKPGIRFCDITTLLRDPAGLSDAVAGLAEPLRGERVDLVVGIESRGFILGAPVADRLRAGFVPARKPGKLPAGTLSQSYELEYGSDAVEMHADAVEPGQRVLIIDDLLATGGTAGAVRDLVRRAGGDIVGMAFLVELTFLNGRERLGETPLFVGMRY